MPVGEAALGSDAQVRLPAAISELPRSLMRVVRQGIIELPTVQTLEFCGQHIVRRIFESIAMDPRRLLDRVWLPACSQADDEHGRPRGVSDYVAALTDGSATRAYERLYVPRAGSALDRD
jgi:dGTPase